MYRDISEFAQGDCKMRTRENLILQGYNCYWGFFNAQLPERFKIDKRFCGFEQSMTEFERE